MENKQCNVTKSYFCNEFVLLLNGNSLLYEAFRSPIHLTESIRWNDSFKLIISENAQAYFAWHLQNIIIILITII